MVLENFDFVDLKKKVTPKTMLLTLAVLVVVVVIIVVVVVVAVLYGNASKKNDESQEQNKMSRKENRSGTSKYYNNDYGIITELVKKVSHSTSTKASKIPKLLSKPATLLMPFG